MNKQYFQEVDDCIMAAYGHVTKTSFKMKNHFESVGGDAVGLMAEDGSCFMMWVEHHNTSTKRKLARQIKASNISIPDFVNKQLLLFL